jgi:PST family polysaccharide transporter
MNQKKVMQPAKINSESAKSGDSYRYILRSTSIIGFSSILNVLIGLIRMKVAAVLLGPSGIGLIGLLQSLIATASTVAGFGLTNAGARRVAQAASESDTKLAKVRSTLFWGTLILALLGGLAVWLTKYILAEHVLGDVKYAYDMIWISIGVMLSVAAGSQVALIRGMQKVGNIARVTVYSSFFSTVAGVISLWAMGEEGVFVFVICAPLSSFVIGHWYVSKLPSRRESVLFSHVCQEWVSLIRLGVSFMIAGLSVVIGHLVVRSIIKSKLGDIDLGYFQSAWMISSTYVGFVLQAMGNEYYPRLSAQINNFKVMNSMVNKQSQIVLLISGPIFIIMYAVAPFVISVLYTHEFISAVSVLRWFIIGDVIKMLGMPLRYVIMATCRGPIFIFTEFLPICIFVVAVLFGVEKNGLTAVGVGYCVMQCALLIISYLYSKRVIKFMWDEEVLKSFIVVFFCLCIVALFFAFIDSPWICFFGALIGGLIGFINLKKLIELTSFDVHNFRFFRK